MGSVNSSHGKLKNVFRWNADAFQGTSNLSGSKDFQAHVP